MLIPFAVYGSLTADELDGLVRELALQEGLDDVFAWGRRQSPPVQPADVIKQDEFTQDVLVPLPSGRWVVYGAT